MILPHPRSRIGGITAFARKKQRSRLVFITCRHSCSPYSSRGAALDIPVLFTKCRHGQTFPGTRQNSGAILTGGYVALDDEHPASVARNYVRSLFQRGTSPPRNYAPDACLNQLFSDSPVETTSCTGYDCSALIFRSNRFHATPAAGSRGRRAVPISLGTYPPSYSSIKSTILRP